VAQQALESITDDLRVPGVRFSVRLPVLFSLCFLFSFRLRALALARSAACQGVESSVNRALDVVTREEAAILKDVPAANTAAAKAALASLKKSLQQFQVVVSNKDKQEVRACVPPETSVCRFRLSHREMPPPACSRCRTSSRRLWGTSRMWRRPW